MMVRIAVVDDEQAERDTLARYFGQLEAEVSGSLEVHGFSSAEALLDGFDYSYDLITLDIDMGGQDGISAARRIRALDESVVILFITNMAQMAIQGYEVRALDFIVKPVSYYSFAMKLSSAIAIIQNRKCKNIVITTPTGIEKFSSDELYYAEVTGHTLIYHTGRGEFRQKEPLASLEESLGDLSFKRCNNCYLINLKYVDSISKDMLQIDGVWLKISRPRKKEFLQALDIVLMEKGLYCSSHGIQWSCMADGSKLDFMRLEDIYAIFGNALDNAIEEVLSLDALQKRVISVKIITQKNIVMIQIQNYFRGQLRFEGGLPLTTKQNTVDHGFGIKSIQYIAEKYNGTVAVETQNDIFSLQILLPVAVE